MSDSVRAALFYDQLDLRVEHIAPQPVHAGHVAIKPKFCGICGSDLHLYFEKDLAESLKGPHPLVGLNHPTGFGHEFSGVVTELGPNCPADLAINDRVIVFPTLSDKSCWACRNGSTNTCSQIGFIGVHTKAGGMSDRAVVPAEYVFKLPDSIDFEVGALIEPLAVAWHAHGLMEEPLTPDTSILILGGGPVGASVLLCLLARGANARNIIVSEPAQARRDFVSKLSAATVCTPNGLTDKLAPSIQDKGGADVVFDCAGVPGVTLNTAAQMLRPKGTIINVAIQVTATVPLLIMTIKELQLKCCLAYTAQDYREVIAAVESGLLRPKPLITKRIRIEDVVSEGLEVLHQKDSQECKILVDLAL